MRVIDIADPKGKRLSFENLVEVHVLAGIRRQHKISLQEVRKAIEFMRKRLDVNHPLAHQQMLTDGKSLFVEKYGNLVSVSKAGQMELEKLVETYVRRIEHDRTSGSAIRLFPFTSKTIENAPRSIVIDPRIQFGRPCLAGTGIPTAEIADRCRAGESIASIAADFERTPLDVEEALRFELKNAA